ncbi:InlB B-repeat-containing protein [Collinsella aerofaciens]|uniref:InlB B-repeat-containing protein n=1 Tax=Collinsella aerofaciens TaxID=74426 RepID=UPI0018AC10C4|nr:InlB B-repeat-containing protein [Collinsella aerofaciens]MDB1857726.1 InlB B-repeat-containing protein [Collinsella aerofaciens]
MDMFVDERQRVSHRRGAIARGVAKRGLVAFLAFAMAFSTTPSQLWAEGAEGIAEAVVQAAPPAENGSGESTTSPAADLNASGMVANGGTAEQDAVATASGPTDKTEDDSAAGNEAPAASTSDASKQDAAVVSAAGEAKAQPAKAESQDVSAMCSVVGTDAEGAQQTWAAAQQITLKEGSTAADLSEQLFKQAGLKADYDPNGSWGWALNTITSPFDKDRKLGYDPATGAYWQLFVNGKASDAGAGGYTLKDGDSVVWCYSKYGDPAPEQVSVTMEIIGKKAEIAQRWTSPSTQVFAKGTSIKDASAAYFDALGIKSKMYDQFGYWGVYSLVSPLDGTELSGAWSFFVNGVPGSQLDSDYVLKSGDKIVWAFAPGDTVPGVDSVVVDPGAARPNWDSDWPGYTSADKVTDAPVPTKDAEAKWVSELKGSNEWSKGISDPLLVGDYLYVAIGSKLLKKNVDTGETVAESPLAAKIDSTSRMVYTGGVILVPLSSGRLQALTVDALATVWVTDELPAGPDGAQQSLASITVRDGFAYFGTASASWSDSSDGYLLCVRISDGKVMWQHKNENSKGYYWAGLAFSGNYGVIADDSGTVSTVDSETGKTVASLKIAERVRTTVLVDGSIAYVVSADGVLHKLSVGTDGTLSELGKVTFGCSSTSTPVLANGKIVVGGASTESFMDGYTNKNTYHYGQLAVIDAETLAVDYSICKADGSYIRQGTSGGGDVKSQPVVSVQNGETYVYFTSNNNPGGIYRYRIGDDEAELLYTPAAGDQQYCMASISVGSDGSFYYVNDSGKLFAVKGNGQRVERYTVTFDANGKDAAMPDSQRVKEGKAATEPSTKPRCKGYTFAGWYTDVACTKAYDFSAAVTADLTLYAKWTKNAVNPGGNGGAGSNGGGGSGTGTGSGTGAGAGSGSGSKGGAIAPGKKPVTKTTVSTKTETKDNKSDKKDSDKSDKKDEKKSDKKSDKKDSKSDKKSDTGAASTTTAKKPSGASEQETGTNPLAIVGVAAGVIGLAIVGVFVFTKRR